MVADLGEKEALLTESPEIFFTTPHFDGYAAVLVRLEYIAVEQLEPLVVEAWLARAPHASPAATWESEAPLPEVTATVQLGAERPGACW